MRDDTAPCEKTAWYTHASNHHEARQELPHGIDGTANGTHGTVDLSNYFLLEVWHCFDRVEFFTKLSSKNRQKLPKWTIV